MLTKRGAYERSSNEAETPYQVVVEVSKAVETLELLYRGRCGQSLYSNDLADGTRTQIGQNLFDMKNCPLGL